ncbi:sphingosine-1-phosphate phosphatase 1 [Elysia marginata]|uniref:Sphingosine-1-phosphate phosphatase 1 n=1 Tax=Elysia marginata TaxID=1093978 RepID=A0AAV4FN03_9GAST|nr:sphingosine-1-phosphate phosphatase 1 [Elysia marginata]
MTDLGKRLLGFSPSDSRITAEFQRICGIKIHYAQKDSKEGSHHNGLPASNGGGNSSINCPSSYVNGTNHSFSNGHFHEADLKNHHINGICQNGVANGFVKKESISNGLKSRIKNSSETNGSTKTGHSSNNQTYDQDHSKSKPLVNGHVGEEDNSEWSVSYSVENPVLYYLFSFGASLGNEIFYILFFSSTLWNFDSYVVRKVLIVWCVIMYLGQAAKDYIRWPRPKSPPVVRLEQRYELEYGMPSTHAMVGVAIPFGMLIYMSGRYEFHFTYGLLFAIAWSILVSFSRLYLGMHSVLDIIAGIGFAILLMGATAPFVDQVDKFLMHHPHALPIMVATCIILCFLYPSLDKWSTARGDTTLVLGVFSGIYAGMWLTGKFHPSDVDYFVTPMPEAPPFSLALPPVPDMLLALVRQVVGVAIVVVVLTGLKFGILNALANLMSLDPKDPNTKRHLAVELPYKYVSYFLSAAAATYVMPLLFLRLGIARPSYYSEIFNLT